MLSLSLPLLRNILPANLHPPPFFAPCSLSIKPPHFMDNLINSVPLSTKSPIFMDNPINSRHLSTKSPVFMDKRQIFYDLSMKPPHFMDNPSEIPYSYMKPHNIEYGKCQKAVDTVSQCHC